MTAENPNKDEIDDLIAEIIDQDTEIKQRTVMNPVITTKKEQYLEKLKVMFLSYDYKIE